MSTDTRTTRFHVVTYGDSSLRKLLLLHGFMGSVADWNTIAPDLSDRYQVIAFDLPGHGETEVSDEHEYRIDRCADAIIGWLDDHNIGKCDAIGYSMGGRLAYHLISTYAERFEKVVIESASPGIRDKRERDARRNGDAQLIEKLRTGSLKEFLMEWYSQPLFASLQNDKAMLAEMIERRSANDPQRLALSLSYMGAAEQDPVWNILDRITATVLLLAGEFDQKYRTMNEEVCPLLKTAESAVIMGAGHNTHVENPREFFRYVKKFLSR